MFVLCSASYEKPLCIASVKRTEEAINFQRVILSAIQLIGPRGKIENKKYCRIRLLGCLLCCCFLYLVQIQVQDVCLQECSEGSSGFGTWSSS